MNRLLRLGIVLGISIGIGAGICLLDDSINQYDEKAIVNRYAGKSAEDIRKSVKTPEEAHKFAEAVYGKNGECKQGAETIAYLLSDNDYPSKLLCIEKEGWGFHWFFMYKHNQKKIATDNGLFGTMKYSNLDEFVRKIENLEDVKGLRYKVFDRISSDFNPGKIYEDVKIMYQFNHKKY